MFIYIYIYIYIYINIYAILNVLFIVCQVIKCIHFTCFYNDAKMTNIRDFFYNESQQSLI